MIRAEEAAGSKPEGTAQPSPQAAGKQTPVEQGVQTGPVWGLALLPSHVPTQQRTFSRACKAGGKGNPPAGVRRNFIADS